MARPKKKRTPKTKAPKKRKKPQKQTIPMSMVSNHALIITRRLNGAVFLQPAVPTIDELQQIFSKDKKEVPKYYEDQMGLLIEALALSSLALAKARDYNEGQVVSKIITSVTSAYTDKMVQFMAPPPKSAKKDPKGSKGKPKKKVAKSGTVPQSKKAKKTK